MLGRHLRRTECLWHRTKDRNWARGAREGPLDPTVMRDARKAVQDCRPYTHTRGLNYNVGVTPSTDAVLRRTEHLRLSIPEASRPPSRGTVAEGKA